MTANVKLNDRALPTPLTFPRSSSEAIATASRLFENATEWAKKNPLPAAAIGVGVGFILGTFVRRMARGK